MEESVISLSSWFNESLLSDIQIFVFKDQDAASFYCHEIVFRLRSPHLLAALLRDDRRLEPINSTVKRVVIVEGLEGKVEETRLFLSLLYDESKWDKSACSPLLDVLVKYELYAFVWGLDRIPEEAKTKNYYFELGRNFHDLVPQCNAENVHHGDILVTLKGTEYKYHCHSIVLATGMEYVKALFRSGMKDSTAREIIIDSGHETSPDTLKMAFESVLSHVYKKSMDKLPLEESFVATYALACKYVVSSLEQELHRKIVAVSPPKSIGVVLMHAIEYGAQPIVDKVTEILGPKFVQSAAEDSFRCVSKEYLMAFTAGTGKNVFQLALESQLDALIVKALENLEMIIDSDPVVNFTCVDKRGNTLLHAAVTRSRPRTIELLLDKGLGVNVKNSAGLTALDVLLDLEGKAEFELEFNMAELVSRGAHFDTTKQRLVQAFFTVAASCSLKNESLLQAWPAIDRLVRSLPLTAVQGDAGRDILNTALIYQNFALVDYLVFTAGVDTAREVSLLKHDGMVARPYYPEHDYKHFSIKNKSDIMVDKKKYSTKDIEIYVSDDNYGHGSYETIDHIFKVLNIYASGVPLIEFHQRDGSDSRIFISLIHFLYVKNNVPEDRQIAAYCAPIKNLSERVEHTDLTAQLQNLSKTFNMIGQQVALSKEIKK